MRRRWRSWFMLIGLALVLRPVFTSNSALLLRAGDVLAAAPLLTALPVLAMASASTVSARLVLRFGMRVVVIGGACVLAVGTAGRAGGDTIALMAGTCIAAAAIGILNVVLPLLARTLFPSRLGLATGAYSAALCGGAAAGATLTAAMTEHGLTNGAASALWCIPALAAMLLCAAFMPAAEGKADHEPDHPYLPWVSTAVFVGTQGALAYCVFGWLTPMLQLRGLALSEAGGLAGLSMIAQVPGCLAVPALSKAGSTSARLFVAAPLVAGAALVGLRFAPAPLLVPLVLVQGLAQGALISIAMMFIGARPLSDGPMLVVSARAHGCGYVLAAAGPQILGQLLAKQSGLVAPFLMALAIVAAVAAAVAQRDLAPQQPAPGPV